MQSSWLALWEGREGGLLLWLRTRCSLPLSQRGRFVLKGFPASDELRECFCWAACVHLRVHKEMGRKAGGEGGAGSGRGGTAWQRSLHQAMVQVHSEIGVSAARLCMCFPLLWAVLALAGMGWVVRIKFPLFPFP